jgi:hypothetical protein
MQDDLTRVHCVVCGQPVWLTECRATDLGQPAHKTCLAQLLKQQIKIHKSAIEHWQRRSLDGPMC